MWMDEDVSIRLFVYIVSLLLFVVGCSFMLSCVLLLVLLLLEVPTLNDVNCSLKGLGLLLLWCYSSSFFDPLLVEGSSCSTILGPLKDPAAPS